MSYTKEQLLQIDVLLHKNFEDGMNLLCGEAAPHDFSRGSDGTYVQDDIMCMWTGYILNYMIIEQTANGPMIKMRPGLLAEMPEKKVFEPSSRIILL